MLRRADEDHLVTEERLEFDCTTAAGGADDAELQLALAEDPAYVHCRKAVLDFLYTRQGQAEPALA